MSTLLRIDSSIRQGASVTREIADTLERAWSAEHPDGTVVHRDLAADPIPASAWSAAVSTGFGPESDWTPTQRAALALATAAADELLAADAVVVGAPLYNFGVSAHLKSWVDLVLVDPRFAPGTTPLTGRRLVLVVARGGGYGPGTPREGWDHGTPYLLRILRDVLDADVSMIETELTLAEVNPAMAELRPMAAELRTTSHELADETGRALAKLVAA